MAARTLTSATRRFTATPCTRQLVATPLTKRSFTSAPLLRQEAAQTGGKKSGGAPVWGYGLAAVSLLAAAGTIGLMMGSKRTNELAAEARKLTGAAAGAAGGKEEKLDYQKVYNAIAEILEEDAEDYDDGSYGPVLVRLAWHCSGTYDKETGNGGSNGATMRFAPEANHGANAGLLHARNKLEPIKQKFPQISYSDLWTLAGVVAVQEMGGPQIPWRPGRQDGMVENCTPDGRLPDGDKGADHLRHIFHRMSFDDKDIVALSGAHALGRCHKDRSGFDGPWTFSPVSFSNEYYKLLYSEKWSKRKWDGPIQMQDKGSKSLMMLTTDMALTTDKVFKQYSKKYAESQEAFFEDFSKAFAKLLELGVPRFTAEPMTLQPTGSA